ncbi:hypothetical protein SNEBB_010286 [Seison nebaliae]|nr:hypothetical protein SNEBB_010286 [Seison nebaliae]
MESKMNERANRFGIVPDNIKQKQRVERFGIISDNAAKVEEEEKKAKRLQRFGEKNISNVNPPTSSTSQFSPDELEKLNKRKERFNIVTEEDRLLNRGQRFNTDK